MPEAPLTPDKRRVQLDPALIPPPPRAAFVELGLMTCFSFLRGASDAVDLVLTAHALGYDVSATNLKRVLVRRGAIVATGGRRDPGRAGGRPAEEFAFSGQALEITDPFAALRPPGER